MGSKLEVEIELQVCAEKLWENLREFTTFFPKAVPHIFEKIDLIEGDGRSVGSIFAATLKPSEMNPVVSTTKERIEMLDEEKKILSYSFIQGQILETCKNFKGIIYVTSSCKTDGALVKYVAEFEKKNAQLADPHFFKAFVAKLFKDVDAYLLKP